MTLRTGQGSCIAYEPGGCGRGLSSPDRDDRRDSLHPRRVMAAGPRSGWLSPARPSAPRPDMTTTALLPAAASTSFSVDTGSFLAIVATSAVAATIVAV